MKHIAMKLFIVFYTRICLSRNSFETESIKIMQLCQRKVLNVHPHFQANLSIMLKMIGIPTKSHYCPPI